MPRRIDCSLLMIGRPLVPTMREIQQILEDGDANRFLQCGYCGGAGCIQVHANGEGKPKIATCNRCLNHLAEWVHQCQGCGQPFFRLSTTRRKLFCSLPCDAGREVQLSKEQRAALDARGITTHER